MKALSQRRRHPLAAFALLLMALLVTGGIYAAASTANEAQAQTTTFTADDVEECSKRFSANCASCHGKDYNTPIDPSYPKLAGQHRDYLEHSLVAYQRGADGANGRGNAIMAAQAKPLSRQDIANIAAYLNSLPGTLVLRR